MADQNASTHIRSLDGLRGLASFFVLISHMPEIGLHTNIDKSVGDHGVLLFFVLSGFLMSYLYLERDVNYENVRSYVISRVTRIVPIYYAVVLASFLYNNIFDHNFEYHISIVGLFRLLTFNGSTSIFWSVGPEFQFYALFVLIWAIWINRKYKYFGLIGIAIICILSIIEAQNLPGILVFSKIHIFVAGVLTAVIYKYAATSGVFTSKKQYMAVFSVIYILALVLQPSWASGYLNPPWEFASKNLYGFYRDPFHIFFAVFIVLSVALEPPLTRLLLGNRLLCFLGEISFSLYLLHKIVLYEFAKLGGIQLLGNGLVSIAVCIVASVAVAYVSYRCIETPTRIWSRLFLGKIIPREFGRREYALTPKL